MFNSLGKKDLKIIGTILTILALLPLYSLRLLTEAQLKTYIELGGGYWIDWIPPTHPSRPVPLLYIFKTFYSPDIYTIFYLLSMIAIPILTLKTINNLLNITIIPLYIYSILIGDFITPTLFLVRTWLKNRKITYILDTLLVINNPEYGVISPLQEKISYKEKIWRLGIGIAGLAVIQLLNQKSFLLYITQPSLLLIYILQLLILLIVTKYYIKISKYDYAAFLISILNPQVLYFTIINRDRKNNNYNKKWIHYIVIASLMILILYTIVLANLVETVAIERNPGLEKFIRDEIPYGSTILTVNLDHSLEGIIRRRANTVNLEEIDYEWNWSEYTQVRRNWELLMDYSREKQIKYIIIEKKVGKPVYWPPPNEYITNTYYLDPKTGKELNILVNNYVAGGLGPYYIQEINTIDKENDLINYYHHYWSNISRIKLDVNKEYIIVITNRSYELYLWFINPYYNKYNHNYTLEIKIENEDPNINSRIRNIQIYTSNTETLEKALLTLSNMKRELFYILTIPNHDKIDSNKYFILKIEGRGKLRISKLLLIPINIREGLEIEWGSTELIVQNKFSDLTISLKSIIPDANLPKKIILAPNTQKTIQNLEKRETYNILILYVTIPVICIPIIIRYVKNSNESTGHEDYGVAAHYTPQTYMVLISIPILLYLIHQPDILGVGWIGGGGFIYYIFMTIPITGAYIKLLNNKEVDYIFEKLIILLPIALTLTPLIKQYIVNRYLLDILYSYWHIMAVHTSIDYLIFGFTYIIPPLIYGGRTKLLALPSTYLVLYGILGILDATRKITATYLDIIFNIKSIYNQNLPNNLGIPG